MTPTMKTYVYEPEKLNVMMDSGSGEVMAIMYIKDSHEYMIAGYISRYELANLSGWEW